MRNFDLQGKCKVVPALR